MLEYSYKNNRKSKYREYILKNNKYKIVLSNPNIKVSNIYNTSKESIIDVEYDVVIFVDENFWFFELSNEDKKIQESILNKRIRHKWKILYQQRVSLFKPVDDFYHLLCKRQKALKQEQCKLDVSFYNSLNNGFSLLLDEGFFELCLRLTDAQYNTSFAIFFTCHELNELKKIKKWIGKIYLDTIEKHKQDTTRILYSDNRTSVPFLVREHIKEVYCDDYENWENILVSLSENEWILNMYIDVYCKKKHSDDFIYMGKNLKNYTNQGLKDWEAAIQLIKDIK